MAMFGNSVKQPSKLANVAGSVGDFLLQYAGARPVFGPTMQRRQEIEFMNERDARNRSLDWRDFVQRETFKRENPPPVNNDTVADYQFIRETLGDEAARSFLKNKTLPPMVGVDIQNPDGSVTRQFYPRGGVPGTSAPQGFDALPPGFVVDEGGASPGGSRPFP